MTAESIAVTVSFEIERGALDVLPAQRPADDGPQVLSGDGLRPETVEPKTRHAARRIAGGDPHVAQSIAAESARAKRAQQVAAAQLGSPDRGPAARIVGLRRQIRGVFGARPDFRRELGPSAA